VRLRAIRKILVIDDDIGVFRGIQRVVGESFGEGVKVDYALNTADGYSLFFSDPPDLCFLDIRFGDDDEAGIVLLKRIRNVQVAERIPIILLSVPQFIDKYLADLEERHYPDDFLAKPLPEIEVVAKIKQWDRTLHAERSLSEQKEELRRRAELIAQKNIQAMKRLRDQHEIASLGLFTLGLLEIIDDTISAMRGYAVLVDKQTIKGKIADQLKDKLVKVVLESTEVPKRIVRTLRDYLGPGRGGEMRTDVVAILDAVTRLAAHELRKNDIEIEPDFQHVGECVTVPAYFVQAVVSLLLFFRDSALKGEMLAVTTRRDGPLVSVAFKARVLEKVMRETNRIDLKRKTDGTLVVRASSPHVYSLSKAIEAARLMNGGVEFERNGDEFGVVFLLTAADRSVSLTDGGAEKREG